jgi:hypothetical protein
MSNVRNWVRETAAPPGTGVVTPSGPVAPGDVTFVQALGAGPVDVYYAIEGGGIAEAGIGSWASGELTRTVPQATFDGTTYTTGLPSALDFTSGVVLSITFNQAAYEDIIRVGDNVSLLTNDAGYLTSFTETDPVFAASPAAGIALQDITNWDTAFGWGDHSQPGYIITETDPVFAASPAAGITAPDITNWNAAFGWGDHGQAGYLLTETDPVFAASPAAGVSQDEADALAGAAAPSAANVVATMADIPAGGTGDMTKAVYDTNDNGVVDNSEALNGKADTAFATAAQGALADTASQPGHAHTLADVTDSGGMAAIDDAPSDTKQYARQDGAWSEVVAGGGDLTNAVFPDSAHFAALVAAGAAVDFDGGNKQSVDAGVNNAIPLAAPGVGSYILEIANSGSLTGITPAPLWDSGTAPTWAGTSVLALFYDGTTWYGSAMVGVA